MTTMTCWSIIGPVDTLRQWRFVDSAGNSPASVADSARVSTMNEWDEDFPAAVVDQGRWDDEGEIEVRLLRTILDYRDLV